MTMHTSLTGLQSAQTDLAVVSNNIANVNATAFKRSRADFSEIIATSTQAVPSRTIGSGSLLRALNRQFSQGAISASANTLDMAISGQGFFAVKTQEGADGYLFTRNGSFRRNSDGTITDAQNRPLQGFAVDANGTALSTQTLQHLTIAAQNGAPRASTSLTIATTLPSNAALFPPESFDPTNPATYTQSSAVSLYDAAGNPVPATVYYLHTARPNETDPTDHWQARVVVGGTEASQPPIELRFDSNGSLISPTGAQNLAPVTPPSGLAPLALRFTQSPATRLALNYSLLSSTQDGQAPGQLEQVYVDPQGLITASYSNGQKMPIGQVALVNFDNVPQLRAISDSHYVLSPQSGPARIGLPDSNGTGTISGSALERSNVDVTEELVSLLTAQRNFQANARAIETDSNMTQAILAIR